MIDVFIVDDHKILTQALEEFLNGQPDIRCVGVAHSGPEAINKIPLINPEAVLLDIGMPGMNGIECCKELIKINPQLDIIGLSTHIEISVAKKLFKSGAKGYISKAADLLEIPIAIKKVKSGRRYIGAIIGEEFMADLGGEKHNKAVSYIPNLTQREKDVLELIAQEYTTDEIGKQLFISSNTVQTHRKNLISKFGVRNSVGLVLKALELKMI